MDHRLQEQIALHRWAVIAEAADGRLTARERGALARQAAARPHAIASILFHRHGIKVSERTVRGQLRRAGLHREVLAAEPKAYSRYEAVAPNERWMTDVLVGSWVPFPRRDGSARARLFLIVDDHSRLIIDGRFYGQENARACQELLRRAITRRGLPRVLCASDNGAPFANAWLARTCGCSASAWCTRNRTRRKGEGSRKGPIGISGRHSWPRPSITASSRSTS